MAGAWTCGIVVTLWALIATITLIWPGFGVGWFGTAGKPDDSLPDGFAGHRMALEMTQIIPLIVFLLAGLIFYAMGAKTRSEKR
jgi:uncharacterized membrane protein